MSAEIQKTLEEKFPFLAGHIVVPRAGRIFVECPEDQIRTVFDFVVKDLAYAALSAITGMDGGDHFAVVYHLNREGNGLLSLKVRLSKEKPSVHTVTDVFPGADVSERELIDLLGISVEGLADGPRYPLPDNWPKNSYPLRKDWKQNKTENSAAA